MQINKQTFLAGLSCILSVAILTTTIPIAFKGETKMATIITIANGDAGSVVRGAINDNFLEVNSELETDTTAIGTLASLTTTAKGNLVEAVNEVQANKVQSIYGEMRNSGALDDLSMPTGSTIYYPTAGLSLYTGSGITYENSALKIGTAGTYLINYSVDVAYYVSGASLQIRLLKNGSPISNGRKINDNMPTNRITISCSFIDTFAQNDLLKLGFVSTTSSQNLKFGYYFLTITKV